MDTLHFERYELKYFVPESLTDDIRRFVRPYVERDKNAIGKPGGRYAIHNLYLDTPRLDFYRSCQHDAIERMKLRVRWYDAEAEGPFFLEIKRKVRSVIVKDRVRVSRDELDALLAGGDRASQYYVARPELRDFVSSMSSTGAQPTIFVSYTREPYESIFGNYARITFDRAICFQDARGTSVRADPRVWCFIDASWATRGVQSATIIELKTTSAIPRWMSDLVAEFDLRRIGYSKYATSVQHRAESTWRALDTERIATGGR